MNAADTGFMLMASAMVMLMTPGLAILNTSNPGRRSRPSLDKIPIAL